MKKPDFDPLLNDLWADAGYQRFRDELKQRALGRIRFRRRARKAGIGLALLALMSLPWLWTRWAAKPPAQLAQSPGRVEKEPVAPKPLPPAVPSVPTISNDELLAVFPPGSCRLVEVNGQACLLFSDASLSEQVMR